MQKLRFYMAAAGTFRDASFTESLPIGLVKVVNFEWVSLVGIPNPDWHFYQNLVNFWGQSDVPTIQQPLSLFWILSGSPFRGYTT